MLNLTTKTKTKPCKIRTIADKLEPGDQSIFWDAINNRKWSARDLAESLEQNEIYVSAHPIWRHRNGECSCSTI